MLTNIQKRKGVLRLLTTKWFLRVCFQIEFPSHVPISVISHGWAPSSTLFALSLLEELITIARICLPGTQSLHRGNVIGRSSHVVTGNFPHNTCGYEGRKKIFSTMTFIRRKNVSLSTSWELQTSRVHFIVKHRQKFRTRDTTRGYARQPEDWSGRRSVQRFVWAFEKNGKYLFKTQRK